MSVVRVCFLGTPEFAAEHLNCLLNDEHYEVVGVVTQPDRPSGRKMQLAPSPVKVLAEKHHLPVLTPESLRKDPLVLETIKNWKAEVAVVVAFGQILPQTFLDSFAFGAVNVHGSLLPLWRGAAPIQRSLEAGDQVTGVSLQKMVYKLDAGPVIGERKLVLSSTTTAKDVYSQMAILGCELLKTELMDYIRGNLIPVVQDESKVTIAPKIEKEESLIQFSTTARKIHNKVRAFNMGPGTYINFSGKRLKIHTTEVINHDYKGVPGRIHVKTNEDLVIETSEGLLKLIEVQPESKSKMSIVDFLKSFSLNTGDMFE